MNKLVVLGTAHSKSTPGKCSPDGRFKEWAYSREICKRIKAELLARGIECVIDVEGDEEKNLVNRCNIVNAYCKKYGASNTLYISCHTNAAGSDGKWHNATGFCPYVYTAGSANSRRMAAILYRHAVSNNLQGNRYKPNKEGIWTANFYVVKHTNCPAVLTETGFQDNKQDVDMLLSEEGKQRVVKMHVDAIVEYLK